MAGTTFNWNFEEKPFPNFADKVSIPTGLFYDNKFVPAVEGGLIDLVNPSTGSVIGQIAGATSKDVDLAVAAAQKAFDSTWGLNTPGVERGKLMIKLAELIEKHADELAAVESLNAGLSYVFSRHVDIRIAAELLRYYGGWADKIKGTTMETNLTKMAFTLAEPIGIVASVVPWNVPLTMAILKIAPALATGNCVILKPSELTPLTILRVAQLSVEAGFPPGVISILPGYGNTVGAALSSHMGIGKISFTGSTQVGRQIMKAAAESNMKRVTLELGGKSPSVVLADANITEAAKWAAFGIMINMGQTCFAGSRVYVHDSIYDAFMKEFMGVVSHLPVGDPFSPNSFNGPQISKTHFDRIMSFIEIGKQEGAKLECGGKRVGEEGYFIEPTVFTDVKPEMRIVREEIFGPVVVVARFGSNEELVKLANDTNYGLSAAIFSREMTNALTIARKLQAGTIWINSHSIVEINVPFGGFRQSGMGREYGEEALKEYMEIKSVHVNLTSPPPM
ncbi:aldehyde dehydrogenase [Clavulina sp. PMI_390]|nr:aldehyde dehydrogenase [Clavulina sp. PMI_390]